MKTTIRPVGTSKGIIIPSALLKKYRLEGELDLCPGEDGILLRPTRSYRHGWAEDARAIAAAGEDELLIPDWFADEAFGE